MNMELNKIYKITDLAMNYAKQNNISFFDVCSGFDSDYCYVKFFVYKDLKQLCFDIVQECLYELRGEKYKEKEFYISISNEDFFVKPKEFVCVSICNLPLEKIDISESKEKISSTIKECMIFSSTGNKYDCEKYHDIIERNLS